MKTCPKCGVAVEEGQRYCGECGTRLFLTDLPPEPVYTDDERRKNDPALNAAVSGPQPGRSDTVPELTLEPELWGASAVATAPEPELSAAAPDLDYERPDAEYHGPAQGSHGDFYAPREERYDTLPNDYTMSGAAPEDAKKLPDETLMLIWSIILTCLCSVCGIVGLVKTVKARKEPSLDLKYKLLSSAKIWLIVGTVLHILPFLADLL